MKTTVALLFSLAFLAISLNAFPTVLRVNNTPGLNVPYATLTAAYNAAVNGDTIYMEGTTYDYGTLSVYKRLVIIGTGYYLSQNPETQANVNPSSMGNLFFYAGSSGSMVMGLTITSTVNFMAALQDMRIKRNNIGYLYNNGGATNTYIEQNMFNTVNGQFNNSLFRNNYCYSGTLSSNNNTLFVHNNVFYAVTCTMVQFRNNILFGPCSFSNSDIFNNVCSSTQVPAGNGNQLNVNMENVFVCYSNCTAFSPDARYQLKAGSPAIGAGANGEDCGMFGGTEPYVLSGMPPVPAIYNFNYLFNNSSINVDMKVKSHN